MVLWPLLASSLLLFHLRMTLGHLGGWGLSRAKEIIASQLMLKGTVKKDHRVEEEMCKLQLRNYKVICKGVTHALLPVAFYFLRASILMPDLATVGICGLLLFTYTHHLLIGNEIIQLTPTRMKMICYVVHIQGVFFAIVMSTVKDLVFFFNAAFPGNRTNCSVGICG